MPPHLRRPSRAPRRGGPARRALLGLGLLIAAGAAPGVASAAGTADLVPVVTGTPDQGTEPGRKAGEGGQGNATPGDHPQGNNTPGENEAGHANGGTGEGVADPDRRPDQDQDPVPDLGRADQFRLGLTRPDRVPEDLVLSGATFAFTPSTGKAPARTCTTDAAGTCTVTWWPRVSGDGSVVVLPPGEYVVSQTRAAPGLAAVTGPIGRLELCVLLCDGSRAIPVTNASLFRTQVIGTVVDGAGRTVAGQQFSLAGQTYAGHPGDVYVAGAATSDADGRLVLDGWFAPGDWTFTPTTPDGSEPLPAQRRTLAPAQAGLAALEPWRVRLDREGLVSVPPQNPPGGGQGGSGTGNADGSTPGGAGEAGSGGSGTGGPGTGGTAVEPGSGDSGSGTPGTGGSGTGSSGTGDGDPVGPGPVIPGTVIPGTDVPGTVIPGADVPGTDVPGTDVPGTDNSGVGEPVPVAPGGDGPGGDRPVNGDPDPAAPDTEAGPGDPDPADRGGDPDGGAAGPRPQGAGTGGSGSAGGAGSAGGSGSAGGADGGETTAGDGAARPTVPGSSSHARATSWRPMSGAAPGARDVVLADAAALRTVGADFGVASGFGVLFVALVFLGLLLYRRRARRER